MPKPTPQLLPRLSAHALKQLDDCPRKFALRYKVGRYWPAAAPDRDTGGAPIAKKTDTDPLALGSAFHQLAHQQVLGLDVEASLAAYSDTLPELPTLWGSYVASPYIEPPVGGRVWTEQVLHFTLEGVAFEVRYDRLMEENGQWTIMDWKTGKVDPIKLSDDWQTKLYLFALVEAGAVLNGGESIAPESVRIVYREVSTGTNSSVHYDSAKHEGTRKSLTQKAKSIRPRFDEQAADCRHFARKASHCNHCHFASLCNQNELPTPARTTLVTPRFIS